jgi:hypothetical protein
LQFHEGVAKDGDALSACLALLICAPRRLLKRDVPSSLALLWQQEVFQRISLLPQRMPKKPPHLMFKLSAKKCGLLGAE